KVGPTIADDITRSAIYAAVFALLLIFLYIFVRFSKWQYSLGAVAALFHDTLIVLGIFSIGHGIFGFSMEIDQAFIAAVLTVIGYSINDTVVVFDRIREYLNTYTSGDQASVINAAVNSTVSRTIITSLTTLFGVLVLFLFGGASIKGFAFAILIGVLVGTYSSIFVATPLVHDLSDDLKVKRADDGRRTFSKAAQKASR
ncbi:MAG: protein translocase subunit SecF, partial [Bacteroidota bacterium]